MSDVIDELKKNPYNRVSRSGEKCPICKSDLYTENNFMDVDMDGDIFYSCENNAEHVFVRNPRGNEFIPMQEYRERYFKRIDNAQRFARLVYFFKKVVKNENPIWCTAVYNDSGGCGCIGCVNVGRFVEYKIAWRLAYGDYPFITKDDVDYYNKNKIK